MRAEELPPAGQARDVVAFGQEVGRVLSDGRVVGRAEPFAKVFPSSRAVKQAVGPTAWVILEDIALDARLDREGRLVADTNVRRIAGNLALAPNTVARHLGRLRDHGFVLHEEGRPGGDGRFVTARYVLDPSAAVERFTLTPTEPPEADQKLGKPCRSSCDTDSAEPCRRGCDTVPCRSSCDTGENDHTSASSAVSQPARHRDLRHNRDSAAVVQQQTDGDATDPAPSPSPDEALLVERLTGLGVDRVTAASLVTDHPIEQVRDALDAVPGVDAHKPAGWVVAAVRNRWGIADLATEQRRLATRRQRGDVEAEQRAQAQTASADAADRRRRWAAAAVAALADDELTTVIERVTEPLPGLDRRALPAVRARLASLAAAAQTARPELPLAEALQAALVDGTASEQALEQGPPPPCPPAEAATTDARLRAAIAAADAPTTCTTTDEEVPTR